MKNCIFVYCTRKEAKTERKSLKSSEFRQIQKDNHGELWYSPFSDRYVCITFEQG